MSVCYYSIWKYDEVNKYTYFRKIIYTSDLIKPMIQINNWVLKLLAWAKVCGILYLPRACIQKMKMLQRDDFVIEAFKIISKPDHLFCKFLPK